MENVSFTDITLNNKESVEISIREDRKVIWINIDGVARIRICRIKKLILDDRSIFIKEGK